MNKAIFLDRDGVLIEDMHYNCDINKININLNLVSVLKELQKDYKLIIITNQSGVARGYFSMEQVNKFNKALIEKLKQMNLFIEDVFVCPHYEGGVIKKYSIKCNCRKPNIGLIIQAKEKYNLRLEESFLIGDKQSDIDCGISANLKGCFNVSDMPAIDILKKIKG